MCSARPAPGVESRMTEAEQVPAVASRSDVRFVRMLVAAAVALGIGLLSPAGEALRLGLVAGCLTLWLLEAVSPLVPTLILVAAAPLVLADRSGPEALSTAMGWAADPVLALFFGGFTLARAARVHGLDEVLAARIVRASRGDLRRLAALLMLGTAGLSMWMSNVASAALMLAAIAPVVARMSDVAARRSLLVALAMAANLGGIATPIGTGPNGIAIAAIGPRASVTFASWIAFGLPLAALLLVGTYALCWRGLAGSVPLADGSAPPPAVGRGGWAVLAVAVLAILAWLLEPLHGVPAPVVALGLAAALFGSGLLRADDLGHLDFGTLILVAGGIVMGRLIEVTGLLAGVSAALLESSPSPMVQRLFLCGAAAGLSAVMSNTATAALLLPVAARLDPSPATMIMVAVATSVGVPFAVSTPPNAMVVQHGVRSVDLFRPGIVILIVGAITIAVTGPRVLAIFGLG